jgi:hypothetical protein
MIGEYDSRIRELCQLASQERDPKKLYQLITKLNRTFEEREEWLRGDHVGNGAEVHSQTS